jgi:uncharacterized glyoxalase superfamily protein PhnB
MLIDCALTGSEKRLELRVPNIEQAWSFYCEIMGAKEVFRTQTGAGGLIRIGFNVGKIGFAMTTDDNDDGRSSLALLADDFGVSFVAIILYVEDPMNVTRRALDAGSRILLEGALAKTNHRGQPVEVIADPFGNAWVFAKQTALGSRKSSGVGDPGASYFPAQN